MGLRLVMRVFFFSLMGSLVASQAHASEIGELSEVMQGRFVSADGVESQVAHPEFVDRRVRVNAPDLDGHVFYQQLNQGKKVYRQRILIMTQEQDSVVQRAYSLVDPELFVDVCPGAKVLSNLDKSDLETLLGPDCAMHWRRTKQGFEGYVTPKTCRIISKRTGKPRRIEARAVFAEGKLFLEERGFDDDLKQLFGTAKDESLALTKQSLNCGSDSAQSL
ncbi:MAG: chromophore lyase CpcT/CpeT [Pseudomonadota bacterium]